VPSDSLGILLISGSHDRAHYAFVLASGAAAVGRKVVLFATNEGCRALLDDWSKLEDAGHDAAVRLRGVAGFGELRDSARDLGVRMIACEAGLHAMGLEGAPLAKGAEVAGVSTFLDATKGGQLISL
jgi:peroxiredoxin family protein